jgi:hypothetical protein
MYAFKEKDRFLSVRNGAPNPWCGGPEACCEKGGCQDAPVASRKRRGLPIGITKQEKRTPSLRDAEPLTMQESRVRWAF